MTTMISCDISENQTQQTNLPGEKLEVKRVITDKDGRIVGLCGDGFKISSKEAIAMISANPKAFCYRNPYFDWRYEYVREDNYLGSEVDGIQFPDYYTCICDQPYRCVCMPPFYDEPALKGTIESINLAMTDTLSLLDECCGANDSKSVIRCPVENTCKSLRKMPDFSSSI